ncbi:MAG: molybdopterin molybdotransferase [Chloroflexota bacterium]|nr:molybdopterin molybdotransferase [Chloroflexota bacterium]
MTEFLKLRTAEEAWEIFRANFTPVVHAEPCAVVDALDRVLAQAARAPHDLPTFVRSTVDGYAVCAADTHGASNGLPAYLDVIAEVPMGARAECTLGPGQAALVHTGGNVPPGADAVVMLEQTHEVEASRRLTPPGPPAWAPFAIEVYRSTAGGENCIQIGEDVRAGELILAAGHTLRPQDIGGLLAVGITQAHVARRPRVGIVSQGDEVVPPDQEPGPGQVRDINSYTLAGFVRQAGGIPLTYPIAPDQQAALDAAVRRAYDEADVVVITAGSSVSYRDLTANAINTLGAPGVLVHGVAIRPGKPTILAMCGGKPVFGLPGNPVSCINIFQRFVTPTIRLLLGAPAAPACVTQARLARNIPAASGRADYVRVRLEQRAGETWAVPIFGKSNLIYTLVRSGGVVEVPLNSNGLPAETVVSVLLDLR